MALPRVVNFGSAGSRRFATGTVVACNEFHQRDMDVTGLGFAHGKTPFVELPLASCGTGDSFETGADHAAAADRQANLQRADHDLLSTCCGPLELLLASPNFGTIQRRSLGPVGVGIEPVMTVPADWWQTARPLGAYSLCGCTVAPGFEFEDFSFLRDDAAATDALQICAPELALLL
jgi:Cupin superfamily (DUF985)